MTLDRKAYYRQYQATRKAAAWPKCKLCGYIARRLPPIGCLECYARTQPRGRKWGRLECELIENHAGKDDPAHLQHRIYYEAGVARSRSALHNQMRTMGIRVLLHPDGYTIRQLMEITGRPRNTIASLIDEGIIRNIGNGRRVLISYEDGQKVIDRYSEFDRPSYTISDAASILGYRENSILKAVHQWGLPSWKHGRMRRVCKLTVDRAAEHLRATGNTKVNWRRLAAQTIERK